jgi:AraC-like DNA-binding protein
LLERCGRPSDLSVRETLRDLIKSYIDRNLRDPGLSLEQLTVKFNCTKRNLHKAFSGEGMTICTYIWRSRLERCRRDLDNPACSAKSITDVAFFWGFNSSTHFSRAFKEAFGVSPRAYRQLRRGDCWPLGMAQSGSAHLLPAGYAN